MKKKNYHLYVLLILFGLFYTELHSQEIYSKVNVPITQERMNILVELGMAVDHAEYLSENEIAFYVTQNELQLLSQLNMPFSIEIENYALYYAEQSLRDQPNISTMTRDSNVANGFDLGSMGGFYTWDEVAAKLDEMKQDYPNLITAKTSIGTSIEGREIWMAKISDNPDIDENEPVAYFDALHHAREPLAMATTINYMFWLLENYETDEQVRFLVDNREIYFVPVVNPDGYEYNRETNPEGGGLWRKNRNPNDGNCVGVDLNRNYSFGYATNNQCSSPDPCSGVYRGENPFSEPETTAVRDFLAQVGPKTAFSTHSTAGSYLMPYGFDENPPAFDIYSEWASVFLSENDYPYGVTFQMLGYTSCGTTRDYMHSEGIYGWTPEIDGNGFWPDQSTIFDLVGENVYPLFYQSWISGAFVDVQSHEIIGSALTGGSFEMIVEVKNVGVGDTAQNVTVTVEAAVAGVEVSTPQNYGTVASRTRADNTAQPFSLSLDPNFEADSFILKIYTHQDGVLNDVMEIPVYVGEKEVLFFDDASGGASNWLGTSSGIQWSEVTDDAYSGVSCFGDSDGGNGENNTLSFFELDTTFDFTGTTTPSVFFMAKYSMEQGDFVEFQLSVDDGVNWITLQTFEASEPWKPYFINLHNYTEQPAVQFRFMMHTDPVIPGDGFYFDDFEVSNYGETILNASSFSYSDEIRAYPNPFYNEIEVPLQNKMVNDASIQMFDIHGRKLDIDIRIQEETLVISNLESLQSGIYFLKLVSETGAEQVQKLIKL